MKQRKEKAAALAGTRTTAKATFPKPSYKTNPSKSNEKRRRLIVDRLAAMPRSFRGTYNKAVKGKSLRAAINAQCAECCGWQIKEVRLCSDCACPLWALRPYQDDPQNGHEGLFGGAESANSGEGV